MDNLFLRNIMLWGAEAQEHLASAHVILFGLGGVGSYTAECLVRSGIGQLTIVDQDTVSRSNRNRQLEALESTLGQNKTEAEARRLLDINPSLRLNAICDTYDAAHRALFFPSGCRYDYIADAIDLISCKLDLVETAQRLQIPIISAMGTGNKLDPTLLEVSDIFQTRNCPLARVMRKELRARGIAQLKVIYSPEIPQVPSPAEAPPPGRHSVPASNPWVPAVAGLLLGSVIVRDLLRKGEHQSC